MAAYTYAYTYAYLGSRIQQSAAKVINYGSSPLQLPLAKCDIDIGIGRSIDIDIGIGIDMDVYSSPFSFEK